MKHAFLPVCSPVLAGNELSYITDAVTSGWISSSGAYVGKFEQAFADYCGASHGIAVCNGTVALHLALAALGVGPGDEVIIPCFTMIASAFAVCYTGAKPVFVDADKDTWNIDPGLIEKAVTPATKAIMPVHIFGNPCDMGVISPLADAHSLHVIEDAAESHGARYRGVRAGNLGKIAAFSFFANKNLTTGEGGMVVTNSDALAEACRYYKNLCFPLHAPREYTHADIGFNYRMSNLHAALGFAQVEKADLYRSMRVKNGMIYRELLSRIPGIRLQKETPGGESVCWMNGLCVEPSIYGRTRDELAAFLHENHIETRLFFQGMHRQPSLKRFGCDCNGHYPVCDTLAENGLYLPSGSGLREEDIARVCTLIRGFRRAASQ